MIHSLYIPALRIQMETLPGRYTQLWFNADRPGTCRILCSEFRGTDHSVMGDGTVTADTGYIRNKILNPDRNKITGYKQVMPTFKGALGEDELTKLIAFIKNGAKMDQAQ